MSQIAVREERTSIQSVAFGQGAGGGNLAPQNLGDIVRFAEVMARADIAIPKHLRDNPGACLAVCMQAFKWEMDPFSVAQKSYKVGDQMAYEAQLIAAVINTRAGLKRRPKIEYDGAGPDRRCIVTFDAMDGSTHVYESPRFAAITTKNSPLWKSDPDQQLGYYSVRAGARRHFPEVILGVYDRDEIEGARDVTPSGPARSAFASRIAERPQEPATAREGFDASFIDAELGSRHEASSAVSDETADESEVDSGTSLHSMLTALQDSPGDIDTPRFDATITDKLTRYARDVLTQATGDADPVVLKDRVVKTHTRWRTDMGDLPEAATDVAKKAFSAAQAIVKGDTDLSTSITFLAEEIGVAEADLQPVTN